MTEIETLIEELKKKPNQNIYVGFYSKKQACLAGTSFYQKYNENVLVEVSEVQNISHGINPLHPFDDTVCVGLVTKWVTVGYKVMR